MTRRSSSRRAAGRSRGLQLLEGAGHLEDPGAARGRGAGSRQGVRLWTRQLIVSSSSWMNHTLNDTHETTLDPMSDDFQIPVRSPYQNFLHVHYTTINLKTKKYLLAK